MKSILMLTAACSFSMLAMQQDPQQRYDDRIEKRVANWEQSSTLKRMLIFPIRIANNHPTLFGLAATMAVAAHSKKSEIGICSATFRTAVCSWLLGFSTKELLHTMNVPTVKEEEAYYHGVAYYNAMRQRALNAAVPYAEAVPAA